MIVSIMQPYLLPYVGYFQLIAASDLFVIYDDVQYIRRGWVNRNRVLVGGAPHWLTIPVEYSPVETPIDEKVYLLNADNRRKLGNLLTAAYAKAPLAGRIRPLLDEVLDGDDANVARFNERAIGVVTPRARQTMPIVRSSEIGRDLALAGEAAILDIATRLGATGYLNPPGGVALYDPRRFSERGLDLRFLRPRMRPYRQFGDPFVPNLSIADVLMFCDEPEVALQLSAYELVTHGELTAEASA